MSVAYVDTSTASPQRQQPWDLRHSGRLINAAAAQSAARQLDQLQQQRENVTVTVAWRELRKKLRESVEGKAVRRLLEGG